MKADYVLNYDVLSVAQDESVVLMARLTAGSAPQDANRHPLNLSVVLDRSGSMAGEKLEYVKQAAQFLVKHLGAEDRLSIVTYDDHVAVHLAPTAPTHKDHINRGIAGITSGGSTNLSGGWLQGCQLVLEGRKEGAVNRVLLLTDGLANVGISDTPRLKGMARQRREEGASTTTMGVGMDFNEDLLVQMASEGGGAFYFIDNPDRAALIFQEELRGLLSVVGQNLVVTLTLSPQVRMVRQLNAYPADVTEQRAIFRLGDIFADEVKTLVLELHIPAMASLGQAEVGRLRFEYDELHGDQVTHQSLELPILVNVASEAQASARTADPDVSKAALLLEAARAREESVRQADLGNFAQAEAVLYEFAMDMESTGLADEDIRAERNMLLEEAMDMKIGAQRYTSYSRKSSTSKAFATGSRAAAQADSQALHHRLKSSRHALERNGPRPTVIEWNNEQRDLTDAGLSMTIGRAPDNDIVIDDEEVAPHHCRIVAQHGSLVLETLPDAPPTFANGGLVRKPFRLSEGDLVSVGKTLFVMR